MTIAASALTQAQRLAGVVQTGTAAHITSVQQTTSRHNGTIGVRTLYIVRSLYHVLTKITETFKLFETMRLSSTH